MLPSRLAQLEKIQRHAAAVATQISSMAQAAANEAEFRRPFANLIEAVGREFDIPILLREEYSLAQGRADAAYNRLIVEYENPGSLRSSLSHKHTAHAGVYSGGANGVYWLEILSQRPDGLLVVRNITEGAKRKVEQVTTVLEPELVYPLLRGRDVKRWHAAPSAYILMVQDPVIRRGIDAETLQIKYPYTWAYLNQVAEILRERAAFKRYFTRQNRGQTVETAPFYSMFNVGEYTFSPYKVVWTRVGVEITAGVLGFTNGKVSFPIETATMVGFDLEEEAHYFCALLNSAPGRFVAQSYAVHGTGSFGSPHILTNTRILKFDKKNSLHLELARKSFEAHELVAKNDAGINEIENQIDQLAAQSWEIADAELQEIQWNLSDLQSRGQTPQEESEGDI